MNTRKPWLDCARGLAVIAMVIYHLAWDLSFFGLIETNVNTSALWRGLARFIAGSFLFLSGISLYLAHKNGLLWLPFLRRFGIIAGAAALVTLVTWYQFPDSYIFFGILHCIALSSIIGLIFVRVHYAFALIAALVTFALPYMFTNTFFDVPILAFIGLRTLPIRTNDFVPLLPWIASFLTGIGLAQIAHRFDFKSLFNVPRLLTKPLSFLGRYSLIIYLIHQPILFELTGFVSGIKTKKLDETTRAEIAKTAQVCRR